MTASVSADAVGPRRTAVVTLAPGSSPAELADQIARLPTGLEFIEAFGDLRLVLVYGAPGVSSHEAARAVAASLGAEDGGGSWDGSATDAVNATSGRAALLCP